MTTIEALASAIRQTKCTDRGLLAAFWDSLHEEGVQNPRREFVRVVVGARLSAGIQKVSEKTKAGRELRSRIRRAAGEPAGSTTPIQVVPGWAPPRVVGEPGWWSYPGGTRIRHLSAARRHGRVVYHRSTIRIEVGHRWLDVRLRQADI